MKTTLFAIVLGAGVLGTLAGCVGGEVGVYGETDAVYYGPEYDNGPWFYDGGWVHGRRWDHDHDHHHDRDHDHDHDRDHGHDRDNGRHEVHAPPRGGSGPHLPNAPRPHTPPPRAPAPHRPENH